MEVRPSSPAGGAVTKKMGKPWVAMTGRSGIETPTVQRPSACAVAGVPYLSPLQATAPAGSEQTAGVMACSSTGSGWQIGCPSSRTVCDTVKSPGAVKASR